MAEKLLVIGFDGANLNVLLKGINNGRLETLSKLVEEGDISTLKAPYPPTTPVSMSSILTGQNPDKHSVFSFEKDPGKGGGYVDYSSIETDTIFDYFKESGKKVIPVNVPMTSPLPDSLDFGIGGFPIAGEFAKPYPVREKLQEQDYKVEPVEYSEGEQEFIDDIFELAEKRFEVAEYLWEKEWNLFFLMFTGDARLQHYIDDEEIIMDYYSQVDKYIGKLIEKEDDLEVLIVSDHGFHPLEAEFDLGTWLQEEGYMDKDASSETSKLYGQLNDLKGQDVYPGGAYLGNIFAPEDKADEIAEKLKQVTHNGENVFREVYLTEELYGESNGPAVIPVPRRRYNYVAGYSDQLFNNTPEEKKTPDREGVIIAGSKKFDLDDPHSTDILPTLLDMFGIDYTGLDGKSLAVSTRS